MTGRTEDDNCTSTNTQLHHPSTIGYANAYLCDLLSISN